MTVGVLATTAHAENRAAARDAYEDGMRHYDLGQFRAALDDFMRAYWNFEDPAFLSERISARRWPLIGRPTSRAPTS